MDRTTQQAPRSQRPQLRVVMALGGALALALAACNSVAAPSTNRPATQVPSIVAAPTASPAATAVASAVAVHLIKPIAGAPDSGITLELTAKSIAWSVKTLTAPAGKVWHVKLFNQDSTLEGHTFVVSSGPSFAERIFTSQKFLKGTFTLDIPGLPAGSYIFVCTIHPDRMTGTLTLTN